MSKKRGRPPKQLSDLPKDWRKIIEKEMSEGASLEEIEGWLDISDKTRKRLMEDNPEFFRAIKRGIKLSRAWWEREGRKSLRDKDFSYVGWYMNMKNRFKWKDRHDVTTDDEKLTGPVLLAPKRDDDILDTTTSKGGDV